MLFSLLFFFFNDTATTEIYTLSLHDALPISRQRAAIRLRRLPAPGLCSPRAVGAPAASALRPTPPATQLLVRSEEHTSELQSRLHLVCRLLLEKKKKKKTHKT